MKEKPLNKKNNRCFPSLKLWVRPLPSALFKIQIIYWFGAICKILRAAYFNNLLKRKEVLKVFLVSGTKLKLASDLRSSKEIEYKVPKFGGISEAINALRDSLDFLNSLALPYFNLNIEYSIKRRG